MATLSLPLRVCCSRKRASGRLWRRPTPAGVKHARPVVHDARDDRARTRDDRPNARWPGQHAELVTEGTREAIARESADTGILHAPSRLCGIGVIGDLRVQVGSHRTYERIGDGADWHALPITRRPDGVFCGIDSSAPAGGVTLILLGCSGVVAGSAARSRLGSRRFAKQFQLEA